MEGHSQLANCVRGKTMALFKPWRYLVSKPPNLDVAKEARILCDADWEGSKSPTSITSILDNRNNTVEALVNDYLGNSDKWLQLELVAYENGFYHKACTYYQCCCNNTK